MITPFRSHEKLKVGKILLACVVVCTGLLVATTGIASAASTFPTMNDAGGIYWRSAPNWNDPIVQSNSGFYPGTSVSVSCYQTGTTVPGSSNTMWVQASWVSGPGRGLGWINEHFVNDGAPINEAAPGIPPCSNGSSSNGSGSSTTSTGHTAAETTAVNWALAQQGRTTWNGECLYFTYLAYLQGGVNIHSLASNGYSATTYFNTYHESKNPPSNNPPYGALVFWGARPGYPDGHVAISLGNGTAVSTSERNIYSVHVFNIAARAAYNPVGWISVG